MADRALERFGELFGPEFGHGKTFELTGLRGALTALDDPHTKLPPIIHVAGTNGKGSTIAFMRAIAEAAGLRVHAFTKPHLHRLQARFLVTGAAISDDALIGAAERVHAVAPKLTQFDAQVAAAFLLFSEAPADLVLLETGMGGRGDSTNLIAAPALSVITPIALDHGDVLGESLSAIAAHKAGILKPNIPAIIGRQSPEAQDVIEQEAAKIGAPLFRHSAEWDAYANGGRLVVQTQTRTLDLPLPTLHGAHQIDNAGLACAALLKWRDFDEGAFAAGITWARLPARLQALTRGPFSAPIRASGGEVWVDAGHNAHAARALAQALQHMKARRPAPTIAIVALRARKDAGEFIAALAQGVDQIIAAPLADDHIAPSQLVVLAQQHNITATTAPSLAAAMQNAAHLPAPRVLICGSFLLAAEALAAESAQKI